VLVTLGVRPTRPDTGYGYIQVGAAVGGGHPRLHRVLRFVEKPDAARARRYLRGGKHLWNAGVFVWSAATLLEEVEVCAPELHRAMAPLRASPGAARRRAAVERVYRSAPSLPVDVAVMERSSRVWTLPVDFAWSDVGTWASLAAELGVGTRRGGRSRTPEAAGNRVIDGDVLCLDASDNLVWGNGRLVALLGVEGLAVVDTGDVILVTQLDRSPDVRRLVAELKARGLGGLT
jgi:mannose-1-phosphate guanylyltransferase